MQPASEPTASLAEAPVRAHRCPVCGGGDVFQFLDRERVPVHQNLVADSREAALAAPTGKLSMCICRSCGFVYNASFDLELMSYDARYDNTQTCSPEFEQYVEQLVTHLLDESGIRGKTVVEVGCGKGHFIRRLVEFPDSRINGIGFDPTYVGPDSVHSGRLRFERRFYDERAASVGADVVVSRHVIEHVPRPVDLLRSIRQAVAARPDALICFETPSVEWILENQVVWDFFYEHCSLFTPASLTRAFEAAGFEVSSVSAVFGDQYMWAEARPSATVEIGAHDPSRLVALAERFADAAAVLKAKWLAAVGRAAASAPNGDRRVAVWGAGAKGVTFANLVDPDATGVHCFIEVNPAKQGKYIPGTGHRIIGPQQIEEERLGTILVLNPNYLEEMQQYLTAAGSSAVLIDAMSYPL
jgi:2-polyprenyl-3-methyl-5-hydroxy-6-metoxy-1,4-benzoquinol methylase